MTNPDLRPLWQDTGNHKTDRENAANWARNILASPDQFVILDTETTALHHAEILQIGILGIDGTVLLDTLVRPDFTGRTYNSIPADATAIHGITDEMVKDAPTLDSLLPEIVSHLMGKTVVVYNVAYDFEVLLGCLIRRSSRNAASRWLNQFGWACAMLPYSAWVGDWNSYRGNYKWQRLPGGDHSAIGDCVAALEVIRLMAGEGRL